MGPLVAEVEGVLELGTRLDESGDLGRGDVDGFGDRAADTAGQLRAERGVGDHPAVVQGEK